MSRNFTLTLLLGLLLILATPTLSAQTFSPPVISNLDGEVVNFQPFDGIRLDNGNAQVAAGSWQDLSRARLRVYFTQGRVAAEDRVWVLPLNQPGSALTISGRNLYYQGAYIGNVKSRDWQPELIVQFTQSANANAISAVIRSLEYVNTNPDNPTIQTRKIAVTLNDGFGNISTPSIVTLNVLGGNKPPVGVDKFYSTAFGTTLNVPVAEGLLSTEKDPEGEAMTATIIQAAQHGNFVLYPTSQFSYTPNSGYTGLDSITYNVCDASGACRPLKALIYTGSSNVVPNAVDDRYYTVKDQVLYMNRSRSILLNDTDPNSSNSRIFNAATLVSGPSNGTLKLDPYGSFLYVPNPGFSGTDQFVYSNCDRQGGCDQATVRIAVGSNTSPMAILDRYVFISTSLSGNVLTNDTDAEGNALTASLVTAPVNGTVVLYANGNFIYTPNAGYLGADSLIYKVCENGPPSLCDTTTIMFTSANNLPPVITVPGTQSVPENTILTFSNNISIADANAGPADIMKMNMSVLNGTITLPVKTGLTFTIGTGTAEAAFEFTGTLADINNAIKTVQYEPITDFNDADSLKLLVNDQFALGPLTGSNKVAILVGAQEPKVIRVTSQSSDGLYALGDLITIQVIFNKPVDVTGSPRLLLETGTTDRYATYLSRNAATLAFRYQVQVGDASDNLDYVSTGALELAGGTIRNTANTLDASLILPATPSINSLGGTKDLVVDGTEPIITSITWPANGIYKEGDSLNFVYYFSENIYSSATTLPVTIGTTTVQADLTGTLLSELRYSYLIKSGEIDADGIVAASLTGSIIDRIGNPFQPIASTTLPGVRVDAVIPVVTAGQVFSIANDQPAGTVIGTIAATDAGAVLPLQNWQLAVPSTTFKLDAATGELSVPGILTQPYYDISVTVTDGVNTSAAVTVRINVTDVTSPSIISMDYPADDLYKEGDELIFTAHTSEGVVVTSSTLPITIGTTTVQAALKTSSARQLTYSYIVQNGQLDANGIVASTLTGTITDSSGNALLPFTPAPLPGVLVDAIPPVITAGQIFTIAEGSLAGRVTGTIAATDAGAVKPLQNWQLTSSIFNLDPATGVLTLLNTAALEQAPFFDLSVTVTDGINVSTAATIRINVVDTTKPYIVSMDYPADGLYKEGNELVFTVHMSEGVIIPASTLPVTIGTTTVQAALKSSTATQLTYAYTILHGLLDADGIVVSAPTGAITDSSGNTLEPFTSVQRPALLVDAIPPVVTAGQVFTIAENAAAGTVIGNIAATDAGAVKPLQNWQLNAAIFKLDNATGVLSLQGALNYETNSLHDISVTVSDGINTSTTTTVRINVIDVNEAPAMDAIANVSPCAGGVANQLTVSGITAGPETAQTVTLSISSDRDIFSTLTIDNTGIIRYALKADATGTATVTVIAKDNGGTANNGTDTYSRSFTASVGIGPTISITSNKGNKISKGDVTQLTATGASSYTWDNGDNTDVISVRPLQKTTYHVTGTAANGCVAEGSIEIDINEDYKLDATNIITPNGDGKNDKWVIRNIDAYPNNEVKVFDRSGRLIYQKKGYLNEWDGSANGKPLQDGTYYFIVDFGPNLPKFKGYITVIRDLNY